MEVPSSTEWSVDSSSNRFIGDFCISSSNSLVNIDSCIGKYCHIDCGGIVLKNSKVSNGTWIRSEEIYSDEGLICVLTSVDNPKGISN